MTIDLDDTILTAIIAAGFEPTDSNDDEDLEWMERYRWDAFMPLDTHTDRPSHERHVAIVRWGADGIDLTVSTRNYVIDAEVHFSCTARGVALFVAALDGLPVE